MPKIHQETDKPVGYQGLSFYCPGCKFTHTVNYHPGNQWQFNGDFKKPTLTPSILVTGTKLTAEGYRQYEEWIAKGCPMLQEPFSSEPNVCHSFVTDGQIQYLGDCSHDLAGQTIELPEFKWEEDYV